MKIYSIIVNEIGFDNEPYIHQESFHSYAEAENKVRELAENFIKDYSSQTGPNPYDYDADDKVVVDADGDIAVSYKIDWSEIK